MSRATEILEFLDDVRPQGRCDDCLSSELDIRPRQTVNQVCRMLVEEKKIERTKSEYGRCGNEKITNIYGSMQGSADAVALPKFTKPVSEGKTEPADSMLDIEKARTEIVRICRTLWLTSSSEEPPRSLSAMINQLKNNTILPGHEANMMLTVCGLRNVYVYEGKMLKGRELAIAENAFAIIRDWWEERVG